jgi:hypothetical protein
MIVAPYLLLGIFGVAIYRAFKKIQKADLDGLPPTSSSGGEVPPSINPA